MFTIYLTPPIASVMQYTSQDQSQTGFMLYCVADAMGVVTYTVNLAFNLHYNNELHYIYINSIIKLWMALSYYYKYM